MKNRKAITINVDRALLERLQRDIDRFQELKTVSPYETVECFTADFGGGVKAQIQIINSEFGPFVDPILLKKGEKVADCLPEYKIVGRYCFEHAGTEYIVDVKPDTQKVNQ